MRLSYSLSSHWERVVNCGGVAERARTAFLIAVVALAFGGLPAGAEPTIYGSLSNFDCINNTGETAHGFEIELDGCLPSDIFSVFGSPFNRYGDPNITTDGSNTFVRYQSAYVNNAWAVGTETGAYAPTDGHSLYFSQYGGSPSYPNVPGDHFGIALGVNPTNTVYHWLVDSGAGTLVYAGTNVFVPAPILTLAPAANPVNPVAVQAVIQAPPANGGQFGDAIWAKVFTTVVENSEPVHLNDLVLGNAVVPPDSETEIEWYLLQTNPEAGALAEKIDEGDVLEGRESVTRRYEFYEYKGGYDPENHEALHDNYDPAYVGAFLGNQNVAVNLVAVPEAGSLALGALAAGCFCLARYRRSKS